MRLLLWQRAPGWTATDYGQHEWQWTQAREYCTETDRREFAKEHWGGDTESGDVEEEVTEGCAGGGGRAEEDAVVRLRRSQHFDTTWLIFFLGCQECANLGALMILWTWRKRIWRYFWDFIIRGLCRALRRCVEGMSMLLMGASDGGEHRAIGKLV